jgi:deoxyribonuclease V
LSPIKNLHGWDVTPKVARELQTRLRPMVETEDRLGELKLATGVDVHFERGGKISRAAVAVSRVSDLNVVEEVVERRPTTFPYVPGLLSFRELPSVLEALERLSREPDLILCDAHGLAHPRRFGLACHLGVLTDLPTVGVAKSRLSGAHYEVPDERGAWLPLKDGDENIGAVLRTRVGVKPVYVSVGHRVSLETAIDLTMRLTSRYRLPEPSRAAHRLAGRAEG